MLRAAPSRLATVTVLLPTLTLFALGALHGAGPDHLAAMGALSGGRAYGLRVAFRFALGHLVVLAPAAVLLEPLLSRIPPGFERWAEILGGGLLVAVGLGTLAASLGVHFHRHVHPDGTQHRHLHHHQHEHGHPHRGGLHLAGAVGALLALSSMRVVGAAVISVSGPSVLAALAGVAAFGLGIVASMSLAGAVLAAVPRRYPAAGPWMHRGLASVAVGVGLYWSVANAFV